MKLISELKTLRDQISKRKKETVKLLKAKDTLIIEKNKLLTEIREFLDEENKQTCQASTLEEESESSDEKGEWEYAQRNRENKGRSVIHSSTSSDASSSSNGSSNNSSSGSTNSSTDSISDSCNHTIIVAAIVAAVIVFKPAAIRKCN